VLRRSRTPNINLLELFRFVACVSKTSSGYVYGSLRLDLYMLDILKCEARGKLATWKALRARHAGWLEEEVLLGLPQV